MGRCNCREGSVRWLMVLVIVAGGLNQEGIVDSWLDSIEENPEPEK